jgi:hypothetical protein
MRVFIPDQAAIGKVLSEYKDIRLAVLFGSIASSRMRQESDIDVGILFEPEFDAAEYKQAAIAIEALSHFFPSHLLDIVILNKASPLLSHHVAKTGKPIYEKNTGDMQRFRIHSATLYQDTAFRRQYALQRRIRRIKSEAHDGGSGNILEAARSIARLFE